MTGRTRAVIAEYLRHHPGATPKAISLGAGLSRDVARKTALRMAADGELTVVGRGHYFLSPSRRRHLAVVPDAPPDAPGDTTPKETTAAAVPAEWRCPCCAARVPGGVAVCPACGWPHSRGVSL
jgi:hypothetical protein